MDMTVVKPTAPVNTNNYTSHQGTLNANTSQTIDDLSVNKAVSPNKSEASKNQSQSDEKGKQELSREELSKLTEHMNKFMAALDADLQFEIHEGTERIMVKFVNKKDNQVIKEFPPHELLDTLAAIQDYVGILLDKKV